MIFNEVKGNLFDEPYKEGDIYAHCISEDFEMGAGIAREFRERFPVFAEKKEFFVNDYKPSKNRRLYVVKSDNILIANLVTKKRYWHKPTYATIETSIWSLRKYVENHPEIKRIIMPRIGSGLDRLSWREVKVILKETSYQDVKTILKETFSDLDVEIKVFYLK